MCLAEPNIQPFEEEATPAWTSEQQTELEIRKIALSPGSAPAASRGMHISHVTSQASHLLTRHNRADLPPYPAVRLKSCCGAL